MVVPVHMIDRIFLTFSISVQFANTANVFSKSESTSAVVNGLSKFIPFADPIAAEPDIVRYDF